MNKIGLLSDIHLGYSQIDNDEIITSLEVLAQKFSEKDIGTVISLGDQIHEQDSETDKQNLQTVVDIFSDFDFFALAGNHDLGYMSIEDFSSITGTEINEVINVSEKDIVLLDTSSSNKYQNVGEIHQEGFDVLSDVSDPIVFTHYPISYTSVFLSSEYFNQNPEGVFAINKFHLTQKRKEESISIGSIVNGHLHLTSSFEFYDDFNTKNTIIPPVIDLTTGASSITGGIYDVETNDYTSI